jgi:hypothetical protein
VRVAKAEAERDRIRAESRIQVTEIEHRALNRFITEEKKKQENIEAIIQQALPHVEERSNPLQVEDDWIFNFFDKCKLISDTEMQSIWSRILADEANAPSAFSKRTVNLLASLDKTDAQIFTQLCTFAWKIGRQIVPIIYDPDHEMYKGHGITTKSLKHLEDIGLIRYDDISPFRISYNAETDLSMRPGNSSRELHPPAVPDVYEM